MLGGGVVDAHPFVRFARIIQAQVVVNGLGRQHDGQALGQRLQAVERAVAADADQPLDAQFFQARGDQVQFLLFVRVDIIARRTDERAALGRVQFGNLLKQRIEMNVRHARIEQAVESLDQADDFDLELVGARDRAVNGGVQGRACRRRRSGCRCVS